VINVRAEFVDDGLGIAGVVVTCSGSTWVTDLAERRKALAAAISRVSLS
jgi:hypothetical protein